MSLTYTVVLREEPEGGYTVLVPALPEIVSYGRNVAEAQRMAVEAIELAVEGRLEDGEEIEETEPVALAEEECTGKLHICRMTVDLPEAVLAHV